MIVTCQLIGGEWVLPLAIFLPCRVRKATILIGATTLGNERIPRGQGLPRAAEKRGRAGAVVAPVVAAYGVGVQDGVFLGLGYGIGNERLEGGDVDGLPLVVVGRSRCMGHVGDFGRGLSGVLMNKSDRVVGYSGGHDRSGHLGLCVVIGQVYRPGLVVPSGAVVDQVVPGLDSRTVGVRAPCRPDVVHIPCAEASRRQCGVAGHRAPVLDCTGKGLQTAVDLALDVLAAGQGRLGVGLMGRCRGGRAGRCAGR